MLQFEVDKRGDLVLDKFNFARVRDDDELIQSVRQSLRTVVGEWELDIAYGFPRYDVLGEFYTEEAVNEAIFTTLYQLDRVGSIDNIEHRFDRFTRTLYASFTFTGRDGEVINQDVEVII